jgi:uncharacterized protein YbjT (DUF2867 family)
MPRYVVAGATGRVGSVVAGRLIDEGHAVSIITRSAERGASLQARGADIRVGTLADAAALAPALENADGFFVILPEPIQAADFHAERRAMIQSIARAVAGSSLEHVVALSSLGAQFPDRMGPITDLHYFEGALRASGKPLTVVRAATFQDYVASFLDPASQSGVFPNFQPDRGVAISMVATRDVGAVAARLLTERGVNDVVDVLGPWYSPRQVAEALGHVVGRTLEIVDIPAAAHVDALCQAGLPKPFAEVVAELQLAIAARRIDPVGDRRELCTTTLEETLAAIASLVSTTGGD